MRYGALLNLLARRSTVWFAAFALAPAVMALFVVDSESAGMAIRFSLYTCALLGVHIGGESIAATRCSFAWTLPRFRREVLREFVACGIAMSTVPCLIVTVTAGGSMSSLLAGAIGFAAFSLGGALCVFPEAPPFFMLGCLALVFFATSSPAAVIDAPLAVVAIALAISTVALWSGFGSRTFRWSALSGLGGHVGLFSPQLQSLSWWPKRRPRPAGARPAGASRARYVGTSAFHGVVSSYQAVRLQWLFGALIVGVLLVALTTASLVWLNLMTVNLAAPSTLWFTFVMVGPMTALAARNPGSRVALPWSRQQHLSVAYIRDLTDMLGCLLATCLATIAVAFVIAHPDRQWIGGLARAGAATALFLPMFQGLDDPPTGTGWPNPGRLMLAALVVIPIAVIVYGLPVPAPVRSPAAQVIVLGVLLVASQVLHWLSLRHYFTKRDLVGEAT